MLKTTPQSIPVTHIVSIKVKIPTEKVQSATSSFVQSVSQNTTMLQSLSQITQIPQTKVQSVLNAYTQNISQPTSKVIQSIAAQTDISKEKVASIIQNTTNVIRQSQIVDRIAVKEQVAVERVLLSIPQILEREKETVVNVISTQIGIPIEKATSITKSIFSSASTDNTFITQLANQTNLQTDQVKTILNTFTKNVNQPLSTTVNNITKQTGIEKEKVVHTVNSVVNNLKTSKDMVKQISQKENIKESDLQKIVQNQLPVVAQPEKYIEQTISIPPSVSLDEYEQVKKMWKDQYERGEVPVSDNIKSRNEWVKNDSVFITNVLNKLVSDSPEIRQQGLDEIGYILPIFLLNNLRGDQLVVYLKAKLEAAKEIQNILEAKESAKEELEATQEEILVDADKPKAEEQEKVMEMKQELKEPKENDSSH